MSQNAVTGREENQQAQSSVGVHTPSGKGKVTAEYDFDDAGGDIGTIFLPHDPLPIGAIVTNAYIENLTVPTSSGAATIAVQIEGADDIVAATAISGAPWSSTGTKDTDAPEPGTESSYIKTTALRQLAIVIATAALTAGRFKVVIEYDETGE